MARTAIKGVEEDGNNRECACHQGEEGFPVALLQSYDHL
jgi:hypothetical protein